jgi:hypothetical protein
MLRAVEAGIANQFAVLDDASLTGTGESSGRLRAARAGGELNPPPALVLTG